MHLGCNYDLYLIGSNHLFSIIKQTDTYHKLLEHFPQYDNETTLKWTFPTATFRSVPTSNCLFILPRTRSKVGKTSLVCDVGLCIWTYQIWQWKKAFWNFLNGVSQWLLLVMWSVPTVCYPKKRLKRTPRLLAYIQAANKFLWQNFASMQHFLLVNLFKILSWCFFSLPYSEKKNMEVAIFKHYHSWRLPKHYKTLENLILSFSHV